VRFTGVNCAGVYVTPATARRVLGHRVDTGASDNTAGGLAGISDSILATTSARIWLGVAAVALAVVVLGGGQ
jgi:hypothetical protein